MGFAGTSRRASAITETARSSFSGDSTTIVWSDISMTTLWLLPPVTYQTLSTTDSLLTRA
jgi:hypothetical protein